MNLHSFVWGKKKHAHTFWANNHHDLSICTDFQHPEKVENQFLAVSQTLIDINPYIPIPIELSLLYDFRSASFISTETTNSQREKEKRCLDYMFLGFPRSNWLSCVFPQNPSGHQVCVVCRPSWSARVCSSNPSDPQECVFPQ